MKLKTISRMIDSTMAQNRATARYCASRGWCSLPNYERQDAELERIRQQERLEANELAQINRQLGRLVK